MTYIRTKKEHQILEHCTKAQTLGTGTTRVSMCDRITVYQPVLYLHYFIHNNVKSQLLFSDSYIVLLLKFLYL
ncbi:hypothetical protein GCM10023142_33180 [Anaerocolumna aminovalerica]